MYVVKLRVEEDPRRYGRECVQDGGMVSFGFSQNSAGSGGYSGGEGGRRRWCKLVDKVIEEGSIFVAGSDDNENEDD